MDRCGHVTRAVQPTRVAAIDLGTVSSRLVMATVAGGDVLESHKHTVITDLGEGVDATGAFCDAAVERVADACRVFVQEAAEFGATCICTTLTSAARDANNAQVLLDRLVALGLEPQIIPGEVEARLTFSGVAHDFPNERIVVADSGGGSTELVIGRFDAVAGELSLDCVRSLDIGCRRVTERFFRADPPARADVDRAGAWAREQFASYWETCGPRPERLVAVGGTVTTLVAMERELEVYDSSLVHLHTLAQREVVEAIERMSTMPTAQIAALKGIQPKRAPVIRAGAVVIRELMASGGYDELTVSENSLLAGMAATIGEALADGKTTIGWMPRLSR